jgi:hypothetical protein
LDLENKLDEIDPSERRSDARIVVNVPVEITEISDKGRQITERTFIEDVSDFGCRFSMRGTVKKGDTIAVRLISQDGKTVSDEPAKLFEIMWVARKMSSLVVGARILHGEKVDKLKVLLNTRGPKFPAT